MSGRVREAIKAVFPAVNRLPAEKILGQYGNAEHEREPGNL